MSAIVRICGVTLPSQKLLVIGLTYIKGIGLTTARKIMKDLELRNNLRVFEVSDAQSQTIQDYVDAQKWPTEYDIVEKENKNKKRLISLGTYRGLRHQKGLPVRGQGSKRNAKTCRRLRRIKV